MELNDILPKQDDPQRLLALNGVPKPFWLSAIEINLILDVLAALLGNVSALYKGEHDDLQYLDAAHPLPEPGSYAQIIVVGDDNLKASWDNTDKKWFLDGIFILPGTNAAYLLKSVYDTNSDGIIDKAKDIQAVLTAGGTKYYGTKDGLVGVFDFPQLSGTISLENRVNYINVNHISDYIYDVTVNWRINGLDFNLKKQVNIGPADATYDSIAVIALDADGDIVVLTEGPAATPLKASVDPTTQLEGTFLIVYAGTTQAPGITSLLVYNENTQVAGGEFNNRNFPLISTRFNLGSNANPSVGAVSVEGTGLQRYDAVEFIPDVPFNVSDFERLNYDFLQKPGSYGGVKTPTHRVQVHGRYANGQLDILYFQDDPSFNINNSTTYQKLSALIPETALVTIEKVRILSFVDSNKNYGFFIDNVRLSGGVGTVPVPGTFVTHPELEDARLSAISEANAYADSISGGGGSGITGRYATYAALLADQVSQVNKGIYTVADASGFSTVDSGWADFEYLGTTLGTEADYRKLSEQESLDLASSSYQTEVASAAAKTTLVDADLLSILDSAAANIIKKVTWTNIKATLKTYFDTLYISQINIDVPLTVSASRALAASDIGKVLYVTQAVTLTYPSGGIPNFKTNIVCNASGQCSLAGDAADILFVDGQIILAKKAVTLFKEPVNSKLTGYGEFSI